MSDDSPPAEQQRFARTQTPESPRPVPLPDPAKIPVLLNQMDQASNDLATYNIPTDQNFAHYGDSLENPAYKTPGGNTDHDPLNDFLRQADTIVANPTEPSATAPTLPKAPTLANLDTNVPLSYTNTAGLSSLLSQLSSSVTLNSAAAQQLPIMTNGQEDEAPNGSSNEPKVEEQRTTGEQSSAGLPPTNAEQISSGIDYQSLLENISQSASIAPHDETAKANVSDAQSSSLPSFPGLPPKPPPSTSHTVSALSLDTSQAQQQPISVVPQSQTAVQSATSDHATNFEASTGFSRSTLATPSIANPYTIDQTAQTAPKVSSAELAEMDPADRPWSPKTQSIYDAFLEDERRYVTEGIWDRFPVGSRLFVGNLPSEKVTKRDLFHRFHQHGRLAQISIKQAYGFVQYHLAEDCKRALDAEQGVEIRGRKVHLEISKPQKGSKASQQNKGQNQSNSRRRSRSPQRRPYSDFRDESNRRRDEYRSRRSPSPLRYRRDDRSGSRDDRRSPVYGNAPYPSYDDEASLPYPRRDPRYVPDVQIIVIDSNTPQGFVNWVEDSFKRKGLNAASTWLNHRAPLGAVVKRQIVEGVQAVVKLASAQQGTRIPLQLFDRSAGTSNVTFNEYVDLDPNTAADIVIAARQRERGIQYRPQFPSAYPQSPYQQSPQTPWQQQPNMPFPPPPQQFQFPPPVQPNFRPNQAPPYTAPNSAASNPSNLQELLANLKGGTAPSTPQSTHSAGPPQPPYGQPYQYGPAPPQMQYGQQQFAAPTSQPSNGQASVQYLLDQMKNRQ